MPHFIVEYTSNIKAEAHIPELLAKANQVLIAQDGVFPTGGIRSRAIELTDYCIADAQADYAFVHCNLTIGSGRSDAQKSKSVTNSSTQSKPTSPICSPNVTSPFR